MKLDDDYETNRESESGTAYGYFVEARYDYHEPKAFGGQILDNRWRRVLFPESVIGVPACARHDVQLKRFGYLNYPAAQALRWWLHANAEADGFGGSPCLETRIVCVKIAYGAKVEAISIHSRIGGNDRSNYQQLSDQSGERIAQLEQENERIRDQLKNAPRPSPSQTSDNQPSQEAEPAVRAESKYPD